MSQSGSQGGGGSGGSSVLFLAGNSGGNVGPNVSGVISLLGTGGVLVSGNAGTNTLTISVSGSGFMWSVVTTDTSMSAFNGYITNSASPITLALPATAAVGDTYSITGLGAGGWDISQNAGQNVIVGGVSTTVGVGGSITSTNRYDDVTIVCVVANTTFKIRTSGTYTVV